MYVLLTEGLVEKLRSAAQRIVQERGSLNLFALIQREDAPHGKLDLVFAADWVENEVEAIRYIAPLLHEQLKGYNSSQINRAVPLRPTDAFVVSMNAAVTVENGILELFNQVFAGIEVAQAIVITSVVDSSRQAA